MTLEAVEVPTSLRRILVRLPNWLGDIVMAAPTVAAFAKAFPEAELVAQTRGPFLPLARALPGVTAAIPAGRDNSPRAVRRSAQTLRSYGFDGAVLMPRGLRAQLPAWRAKIPVRVGYGQRRLKRLLTHPVHGWRPLRGAHRRTWFAALLAGLERQPEPDWRLTVPHETELSVARLLPALGRQPERPLVALEPGASYGAAKCWPAAYFGQLARRLIEELGCDVITVGTEGTLPIEAEVAAHAGERLLRGAGRTPDVLELAGVLASADVVVSNDTGPMHVAGAVGTPVVALFGASNPSVSSPLGTGIRRVFYEPEPCSPCFLRTCPIPGHPCLSKIPVARVFEEVASLLEAPRT